MEMDPLADFFSDNSNDNDSFFENAAGSASAKKVRSTTAPTGKPKGKLEDLFGIKEKVEKKTSRAPKKVVPFMDKQKLTLSNNGNDPVTADGEDDDLGFDPKKPKAGTKLNLFDDFLVSSESKRPATAGPAVPTGKQTISRQSTDTTTENSTFVFSQTPRPKTSTGRRSSGQSAPMNTDPLGLFGTGELKDKEPNASISAMSTPKAKKLGTSADWLGLNNDNLEEAVKKTEEHMESPKRSTPSRRPIPNSKKHNNSPEPTSPVKENATVAPSPHINEFTHKTLTTTSDNILHLGNLTVEAKNSLTALQHRESQLMFTRQMQNQEKVLLSIQRKQEKLLLQQEQQFQSLLHRQIQRQQKLEDTIKVQQQHINAHMQMMMAQQTSTIDMTLDNDEQELDKNEVRRTSENGEMLGKLESNMKRLELEKVRLEELVESMKMNHQREIEMVENTYKKQLNVLEEHLGNLEGRFKTEVEELKQFYGKKLDGLEADNQRLKSDSDNELATLKHEHEDSMRKLRKSQEEDLEMLKDEHRRMLDNIRQAKMFEFATVQESGSYLETLRAASSSLENVTGGLQGLRDEMTNKIDVMCKERERNLEQREHKIEESERLLKLSAETAEDEKRRLMELVGTLELRLNNLSKETADKDWQLRQKMIALDVEKSVLEREREHAREQLRRDEQRISDLKEQQLSETQRIMGELNEERQRLAVEWKRLDAKQSLNPYPDLERQRLEAEAAAKVAQDATTQLDAERERFVQLQRGLEQKKRDLIDKEHRLRAKEDDINQELNAFRTAERKSQESHYRARIAEHNYYTKLRVVQRTMREMAEKEANLAEERMLVAKERISLKNLRSKMELSDCPLCMMNGKSDEINQVLNDSRERSAEIKNDADKGASDGLNASSVMAAASDVALADHTTAIEAGVSGRGRSRGCRTNKRTHTPRHHGNEMADSNLVDQLLDGDIEESYRKMHSSINLNEDYWPEMVLDDDTKEELAMHKLEKDIAAKSFELLNLRAKKQ